MKKLTCTMEFNQGMSDANCRPTFTSVEGYDSTSLAYRFEGMMRDCIDANPQWRERYIVDSTGINCKAHVMIRDYSFNAGYGHEARCKPLAFTWIVSNGTLSNRTITPTIVMPSLYTPEYPDFPVLTLAIASRKCKKCGGIVGDGVSPLDSGILLCENCSQMLSYGAHTFAWKYAPSESIPAQSFGFELELCLREGYTSRNAEKTARYTNLLHRLILAGFLRTGDGTVDDEMKSPIFCTPYLPGNLKKALTIASEFTRSESVGTHIHVAYDDYNRDTDKLYDCLYLLEEYLIKHPDSTRAIWGRYFTGYAHFPMCANHGSWVQLRDRTIEWRLAKLTSYEQFSKLIKFVLSATNKIAHSQNHSVTAEDILSLYVKTFALSQEPETCSLSDGRSKQRYSCDNRPYGGYEAYHPLFRGYRDSYHDDDDDDDRDYDIDGED